MPGFSFRKVRATRRCADLTRRVAAHALEPRRSNPEILSKIMYDPCDPEQRRQVGRAVDAIFELVCRLGGTLTGEHGIGLAKAPYMRLEHDGVALQVMQQIKDLLDPNRILNPGKMGLRQSG